MGRSNYVVVFFVALLLCATMVPSALAEEPPAEPPAAPVEVPESEGPEQVPGDDDTRTPPDPVKRIEVVRTLVFPVVGPSYYYAGFGACRDNCTREHHGIDIMSWNWKGLAVVAAHDGTVSSVTYDRGNAGCSVRIKSRDRWETRYYHLNNDVPGTDTLGGECPAKGIEVGTKVSAGQVIAWLGDSGNAETTPPHIHFELRTPSGYPVDPYKSLKRARHIAYEWLPSDLSEATLAISRTYKPDPTSITIVVPKDEMLGLTTNEYNSLTLMAPVVVIDPDAPASAVEEIARLGSDAIIIMSDMDVRWLQNELAGLATIIQPIPLPSFDRPNAMFLPDSETMPVVEPNTPDRFITVIAGQIDRIRDSYGDDLEVFSRDHQALVLTSTSWGRKYLGQRSRLSPGRYANRNLLWWNTGDGWIGTESMDDAPPQGIAYLTERMATPWTLAYLASLSELDPMPVWRSR